MKEPIKSTSLVLLLFIVIAVFSFLVSCSSCSKSGRLNQPTNPPYTLTHQPTEEKVVILNHITKKSGNSEITSYKVKRITKGVIDFIYIPGNNIYDVGDTMLFTFSKQ